MPTASTRSPLDGFAPTTMKTTVIASHPCPEQSIINNALQQAVLKIDGSQSDPDKDEAA